MKRIAAKKKVTVKKATERKATEKKATEKKVTERKATEKKVAKKEAVKKVAEKKVAKKEAVKKVAEKKVAKKEAVKKVAEKKVAKKKVVGKKPITSKKSDGTKPKLKNNYIRHMIEPVDNKYWLDSESCVKYYPRFIDKRFEKKLIDELLDSVPWTHGVYQMFGKPVKTPRLLYSMRSKDQDIKDSYSVTDSMEWTPQIKKLKKMIETKTGRVLGYAQLNYYRDGNDYIGYHNDKEVKDQDIIASISLGVDRTFSFKEIIPSKAGVGDVEIHSMTLEGGSLLVMDENSAKHRWKHMLPKMTKLEEPRINVTFRPK